MELLDRLGHASSKADEGPREPPTRRAGSEIPSSASADEPLPRRGHDGPRDRGSRGIGKAIALRFARDGAGASPSATCATTAPPRRRPRSCARSAPSRCSIRGNVASSRVAERGRRARPARRARPQRGDRGDPPGARDRGQALGLDAGRERARVPLARAGRGAADAARLVDRRDLVASARTRARELRPGRDVESCARGARPLPRGRARSAGIRVNAVSGGVVETGALDHFPNREQMLAGEPGAPRRAGSSSPTTSPPRSRSSARRTRDDPRPDADRRRRLLAVGVSAVDVPAAPLAEVELVAKPAYAALEVNRR